MLVIKKGQQYWDGAKFQPSFRLAKIYGSYIEAGKIMDLLVDKDNSGLTITHLTTSQKEAMSQPIDYMAYIEAYDLYAQYFLSDRVDQILEGAPSNLSNLICNLGFVYDLDDKCEPLFEPYSHLSYTQRQSLSDEDKAIYNRLMDDFITYVQEWEPGDCP